LAERLFPDARHLVVLRGGMSWKELGATIPDSEQRVLLAAGRYLGEDFDDAKMGVPQSNWTGHDIWAIPKPTVATVGRTPCSSETGSSCCGFWARVSASILMTFSMPYCGPWHTSRRGNLRSGHRTGIATGHCARNMLPLW
jgi:hypothetical protein